MKKIPRISVLYWFLVTLFFFGCSSIEVSQDYEPGRDFKNLKSYAWKSETQEKTGNVNIDSPLVDNRIRNAIEKALSDKGFIKSGDKTVDFEVRYSFTLSRKTLSRPVNTGIGFGFGHYRSMGAIGIQTGAQIDEYDEGLLIIDFLQPDGNLILWRGKSTREVETHTTPDEMIQETDQSVEKTLEQFPPVN